MCEPDFPLMMDDDGLVKLELPDIPADWLEVDSAAFAGFEPPPAAAGLQGSLWQEREASLRKVVLPVPGSGPRRVLNLVEDPKGVLCAGSTGSVLWPAAIALVKCLDGLLPSSPSGPPRCAVDLGAGLGAVGLFLAVHKGLRVVVSEVPESVPLLERCVAECLAAAPGPADAKAAPLRWGDIPHMAPLGTFDLVVGSDITYRQECLDDMLRTAEILLAPGGKFLLSLQDRDGEVSNLEAACQKRGMAILSKEQVEISESDVDLNHVVSRDYCKGEDGVVKVWLFDLAPKTLRPAPVSPVPAGSPEDIEAEFERLTGIRPEKLLLADFRRCVVPAATASPKRQPQSNVQMKDAVVQDLLNRGLGDYLCELDEDLRQRIDGQPFERRPRTAKQKQAFAAAFYAGEAPPAESVPAQRLDDDLGPEETKVAAVVAGGSAAYRSAFTESFLAEEAAAEAVAAANAAKPQSGIAKLCLPGLVWDVDLAEAEQRLTATISFGEDAWWALQGSKVSRGEVNAAAFKEAIDFQLSERELRVLHAGTPVLELELPFAVDAAAAAAKLCSRRRRVVVRAPLRR